MTLGHLTLAPPPESIESMSRCLVSYWVWGSITTVTLGFTITGDQVATHWSVTGRRLVAKVTKLSPTGRQHMKMLSNYICRKEICFFMQQLRLFVSKEIAQKDQNYYTPLCAHFPAIFDHFLTVYKPLPPTISQSPDFLCVAAK